ncbi:MAG: PD-(D/E)XK nuclease family protein [Bacteroidia bacterium]
MSAFIQSVSSKIITTFGQFPDEVLILVPNHRTALYLKTAFKQQITFKPYLIPNILTVPEWLCQCSGLELIPEHIQILELYVVYQTLHTSEAESFESFCKWGNLVLQDFNMLDYALADARMLYTQLHDIKTIAHWSLNERPLTARQDEFLHYMKDFYNLYIAFTKHLKSKSMGYMGMIARHVAEHPIATDLTLCIIGAQDFSKAEQYIFNALDKQKAINWFWDLDAFYMNSEFHEGGKTFRRLFKKYPHWRPATFTQNLTQTAKEITAVAVPGISGQAIHVAECIEKWLSAGIAPESIAVIVPHESMIIPLLRILPQIHSTLNISLGFPMSYTNTFSCIKHLLTLQHAYYKTPQRISSEYVITILKNSLFKSYVNHKGQHIYTIIKQLRESHGTFTSPEIITQAVGPELEALLSPHASPQLYLIRLNTWLESLTESTNTTLEGYTRNALCKALQDIQQLLNAYFKDIRWDTFQFYTERIFNQYKIPLQGEPVKGIQILGLLESRCLDFSHFIIVNTNEGVIPGSPHIGFFPNDLKYAYELPLPQDQDAIYAYYIYRLLHRCKAAVLMYDSENAVLGGGEQSRFITQMEAAFKTHSTAVTWRHYTLTQDVTEQAFTQRKLTRPQTPESLNQLQALAFQPSDSSHEVYGLSSSSFHVLKSCRLRFYYQYIISLQAPDELDDHLNAGEFGTLIHKALEELYKPLVGIPLTLQHFKQLKQHAGVLCETTFTHIFKKPALGKNKLMLEVAIMYVAEVIKWDETTCQNAIKSNVEFKITSVECLLKISCNDPQSANRFHFNGRIDRIDKIGETYRIIDYKSSVKEQVKMHPLQELVSDPQYQKTFQLLWYAWMVSKHFKILPELITPALLDIKQMKLFPIRNAQKEPLSIHADLLQEFESLVLEQCRALTTPDFEYLATDDESQCEFCPYTSICQR